MTLQFNISIISLICQANKHDKIVKKDDNLIRYSYMRTFSYLFKKYRLKAEFETFADFGNALSGRGYFYENSIFSHWQKGTRIPTNRKLLLAILQIFVDKDAIQSFEEANEFLASVGLGYLTEGEKGTFFREKKETLVASSPNQSLIEFLSRLTFIFLGVIGIIVLLVYAFVDIKNIIIFIAFGINFALSFLLYTQARKSPVFLAFLITVFGISMWDLALIFYRSVSYTNVLLSAKFLYLSPVVIPTGFLLFGLFFQNEKVSKSIVYFLIACTTIIAALTLLKDAVIVDVILPKSGERFEIYGWAYSIYRIYFLLFFALVYYTLFKKYLKSSGDRRRQLLYIGIGMIMASVPPLIIDILLPHSMTRELTWTGPLWTIFWVGGAYWAIVKYRLFNLLPYNKLKV